MCEHGSGGAIVDLRPYAAKLKWEVGIGTKHVQDASYPFLIQEKYSRIFHPLCRRGNHPQRQIDLSGRRSRSVPVPDKSGIFREAMEDGKKKRILTLKPVDIEFCSLTMTLQTRVIFTEGSSEICIERHVLKMSDPSAKVELNEYMVACYGTTEYPEDMTGITLTCTGSRETKTIDYAYKCREESMAEAKNVSAVIPAIETKVSMSMDKGDAEGYIREGYAFSPMFTLGYKTEISDKEVVSTWLKLEKAD